MCPVSALRQWVYFTAPGPKVKRITLWPDERYACAHLATGVGCETFGHVPIDWTRNMTVREVVERCGGSAKVARDIGLSKQSVYHAMRKDRMSEVMAWRILDRYAPLVKREDVGLPPSE